MRQIDVNLATHDFFDRSLITILMVVAAAFLLTVTGFTVYQYADARKQLDAYSIKIERTQALISQKNQQQLEARKKPGKKDIRRLSEKTAEINRLIARDAFPWNRFLDQLERKLPEGLFIETVSLADNYDKLVMTGRADAAHKVTFFLTRLEEWELVKTTIIRDLGLKPIVSGDMANAQEGDIGFTLECMITIEKLLNSSDPAQLGRILKHFSKH